ncbi:MAG: hypothetical protein QOE58_2664 [Actinomycetota bacterium]|jgi:hypothetical protein|nr:hypothetical protein [Actinomycetota bacterium]
MNATLWALQGVLALAFSAAGLLKLVKPRDQLIETLGEWLRDFPAPLVKPLGAIELAAAAGLVLPPATGIMPILAGLAGAGLVLIMVGAVVVHVRRREVSNVMVNLVLGVIAGTVAWGRIGPYSF